jgi:hypothetical protein
MGLFNYAYSSPPVSFFPLLNLTLMSYLPQGWTEILNLPIPVVCPCHVTNLLSLTVTEIHACVLLGQMTGSDMLKLQQLGLWCKL